MQRRWIFAKQKGKTFSIFPYLRAYDILFMLPFPILATGRGCSHGANFLVFY